MNNIYVEGELPKKGACFNGCPYAVTDTWVYYCPFQQDENGDHNYLVTYMTGWGMYTLDKIGDRCGNWYSFEDVDFDENIEVIGNIHDNPELLEGL